MDLDLKRGEEGVSYSLNHYMGYPNVTSLVGNRLRLLTLTTR